MKPLDLSETGDDSLFRALVESAPDALVIVDRGGTIVLVNAQAERLFGYPRDELLGTPVEILLPERQRQHHREQRAGFAAAPHAREMGAGIDLYGLRKSGEEFQAEIGLSPLTTPGGMLVISSIRDVTDHKRVERALREKSAELARYERDRGQHYLDTAQVILLALDLDRRITLVNRYACTVLGWSADELLGRDWVETCLPPLTRAAVREKFHSLVAGDVATVENLVMTSSGEERLIEWRNTLLRDKADTVVGTFSSGTDITERRRGEDDLRLRERLSALAAAVGLSLASADSLAGALQQCAEALVTHVGAALARIWTINEAEGTLELRASAGLYTHMDGPHGKIAIGRLKIGRIARARKPHVTNSVVTDPEVHDHEWARREGLVSFAGYPFVVDGNVVGVMALFARHALSDAAIAKLASVADHIAVGIERHRGADALRAAEERMRFALQNANVGIWDMDYVTGVLRWSDTIAAQYGLQPGTFGGTFAAFLERVHPDDRQALLATLGAAMTSGADFTVANRALWPDGTTRWLNGAGRVQVGEHGEPIRAVGISQDVSDRKRADAELERLNTEIQRQRLRVFRATMRTVQDIVNNLLNSFALIRLEAGDQLPAEALVLIDQTIDEATAKLGALGDLETVKEREMGSGPGIDYPGSRA